MTFVLDLMKIWTGKACLAAKSIVILYAGTWRNTAVLCYFSARIVRVKLSGVARKQKSQLHSFSFLPSFEDMCSVHVLCSNSYAETSLNYQSV